ncbi:MAG: hypothetical protein ABR543_14105 [Gemmatimonadaceae bacterium]
MMRTVLIFTHECAPFHRPESTVGAQRPAQFAKYLPQFGWRALVICCDASRRGSGCEESLEQNVRAAAEHADPHESLIVPTASLAWNGVLDRSWRALLPREGRNSRTRDVLRKPLTTAKLFTGDYSQSWQPCARRAAKVIASSVQVHACVGEHSPDAGIFLARWFSHTYGVPWIADFRDPVLQPLNPVMRRVYTPIVRRLVSSAAALVNVTPYWSELDSRLFGRPVTTIPNGFDPEEFAHAKADVSETHFVIAYTGNIWAEMRPETFFAGLAELRGLLSIDDFRSVLFRYRGLSHERVAELAERAGVTEVVESKPFVPREQSLGILKGAQCLLLLSIADAPSRDIYLRRGIYPGKTFEYFGAQRPILCVPGDHGQLDALLTTTRTGVSLRTPREVAVHIAKLFAAWRNGTGQVYRPETTEVERYSRRALTGQLAHVLDRAAGKEIAA